MQFTLTNFQEDNSSTFEIPDYHFDNVFFFSDKIESASATLCKEGLALVIMFKDSLNQKIDYVYSQVPGTNIQDVKIYKQWKALKDNLDSYDNVMKKVDKENQKPASMLLN